MDNIIILISYLIMVVGIAGTILPALPGLVLVLAGMVLYGWYFGFDLLGYNFIVTMVALTAIGTFMDIMASMFGAKKYGASKISMLSMLIGIVFGLFTMGFFGLIIGPVIAVIITEMIKGRPLSEAFRITLGIITGFLGGMAIRFFIGITMLVAFTIRILL